MMEKEKEKLAADEEQAERRRITRNEYMKEWSKRNPEKVREINRRSYMRHRERILAENKTIRREKQREYVRRYASKNKEKLAAYHKEWQQRNAPHIREYQRQMRLRARLTAAIKAKAEKREEDKL